MGAEEIQEDIIGLLGEMIYFKQEEIKLLVVELCENLAFKVPTLCLENTILRHFYPEMVLVERSKRGGQATVGIAVFQSLVRIVRRGDQSAIEGKRSSLKDILDNFFFECCKNDKKDNDGSKIGTSKSSSSGDGLAYVTAIVKCLFPGVVDIYKNQTDELWSGFMTRFVEEMFIEREGKVVEEEDRQKEEAEAFLWR